MLKSSNVKITEKGVSVFLAIIILSVLLAIGLGLSAILVSQIRMIKEIGDSISSFFAADTGAERMLYEDKMCRQSGCGSLSWSCLDVVNCDDGRSAGSVSGTVGNASYQANTNNGATSISSQGIYKGTRRAVKIER
jgi:hypothetical protein